MAKNKKAAKINAALGVNILDESRDTLTLVGASLGTMRQKTITLWMS